MLDRLVDRVLMVVDVADLLVVILALLHSMVPEPGDVSVVADVDGLVYAFQKFFAFKGLDGRLVGDALEAGLGVVDGFGEIDFRSGMIRSRFRFWPSFDRGGENQSEEHPVPFYYETLKKL